MASEYTEAPQILQEVTITATILIEAATPAKARDEFATMSLEDIGSEIDRGEWLGMHWVIDAREVSAASSLQRQQELAGDGSFFPAKEADQKSRDPVAEILKTQIEFGVSSTELSMIAMQFLREANLQVAFAGYLRDFCKPGTEVVADPEP